MNDFEFERRFYCRALPQDILSETPTLIVQGYYVHQDNYALRVRIQAHGIKVPMNAATSPLDIINTHHDAFTRAYVTVKGPAVGGTRYEAEQEIDAHIATQLLLRGGKLIAKNRYSVWFGEDGWSIDVFGGANAPLIIAEAERSTPVTNLTIPSFCTSEITDMARFSNDGLAAAPFSQWHSDYETELANDGAHFEDIFGQNHMEQY